MAADFEFSESNGAGEVVQDGIANVNFGSTDDHELTPASYPVVAGENSYWKCIRAHFEGTFEEISNMKFWKSAGAFGTGEAIVWKCDDAYVQPAETALSGSASVPTAEPGGENITPSTIESSGYTDYIFLQLQTTGSTPAGAIAQKTFTFKYDEV